MLAPVRDSFNRLLGAVGRIPLGVRIAVLAVAAALVVAVTVARDDDRDSESTVAVLGTTAHSPYLGTRAGGSAWMRSRPKRLSVIWAIGDGADGGEESRTVAAMVGQRRVDRLLYLGDVYETGTASEFQANYDSAYHSLDGITAPTIGNHELPNVATGYDPYWAAVRGTPPPAYYAFAASGWQLISLNSNTPASPDQLSWLNGQIDRTPRYGTCRIAFMHHPRFSAGSHGDDPALQGIFDELQGHASILLAGHDHDMQRMRPVDGITQYVDGAGGRELYPVNGSDPRLAFGDDTRHGALRIGLTPNRAVLTFVGDDGSPLDRSVVTCRQH